jgi:hypothetical protein
VVAMTDAPGHVLMGLLFGRGWAGKPEGTFYATGSCEVERQCSVQPAAIPLSRGFICDRRGQRVALWQYVSTITKTMLLPISPENRIAFWVGPSLELRF